jgi:pyruvate kinase
MNLTKKDVKVLCTVGPSSLDKKVLRGMYENGMNAVRINTAHSDINHCINAVKIVRSSLEIPIILDIKGPELRIRTLKKRIFPKNEKFNIGFNKNADIFLNHNIIKKISIGGILLVEDGKYALKVISKSKKHFTVKTMQTTIIEKNKSVNIPDVKLNLPQLNTRDKEAIKLAKKEDIEYIALSFCRNKKDILNLRKKIGKSQIKIIAKIESKEGIKNIDEIIEESDGVMVARGDLGVELPPEKVPLIQKKIINDCNQKGKLVIVATQMLHSMTENPTPTRAEISDIANAVLDGADCLMLSGETAVGNYPEKAVRYMSKVAIEVEPRVKKEIELFDKVRISESISRSAYALASTLPITKIICFTDSGFTASMIARFRLNIPIYAVTKSEMIRRQLMLYFSLIPIVHHTSFWSDKKHRTVRDFYKKKIINKNDLVLFTAGLHTLKEKKTNTIQVHKISELLEYLKRKT